MRLQQLSYYHRSRLVMLLYASFSHNVSSCHNEKWLLLGGPCENYRYDYLFPAFPRFLASSLPPFLASLPPCFLATLLPCFPASLLHCFLPLICPLIVFSYSNHRGQIFNFYLRCHHDHRHNRSLITNQKRTHRKTTITSIQLHRRYSIP